jgi:hypothetical protein
MKRRRSKNMKRSHSRHTYPMDKMIPKELFRMNLIQKRISEEFGIKYFGESAAARKALKLFHTRKSRRQRKSEITGL